MLHEIRSRWVPGALLAAFLSSGCTTVEAPPVAPGRASGETTDATASSGSPRRVILISLDGAAALDLHRYYEEGEFAGRRGFRRFFEEGVVAEALVPVDPTITAVNHATLATGALPAATGIVSNTLRLPGAPLGESVRGFDIPIEVETLWEAARRQGKRVAVATWPSVDGQDDRRRGDYGFLFVNDPEHPARLAVLDGGDWREPAAGAREPASRSPVRYARLEIEGGDGALLAYGLYAMDRVDDGEAAYDALVVRPEHAPGAPEAVVEPGGWAEVVDDPRPRFAEPVSAGPAVRGVKLLALAPDLSSVRLYLGGSFRTRAYPRDYLAALARAGLNWPGAPDDHHLQATWAERPGIDAATFVEQAGRFAAFYGAALERLAAADDWDLALVYLPMLDEVGHATYLVSERQTGWSPERQAELDRGRRAVWRMVDGVLARLLAGDRMAETAVVVVSDHGMAPIHGSFDPNVLLRREGLLATDAAGRIVPEGTAAWATRTSATAQVYLRDGLDPSARQALLDRLAHLFRSFETGGERPLALVATRAEVAAKGFGHPNGGDLVLIGAPGWNLSLSGLRRPGGEAAWPAPAGHYGGHGYLAAELPAMEAIYLAVGPGVGRGRIGKLRATAVAGRVAGLLGIEPPAGGISAY